MSDRRLHVSEMTIPIEAQNAEMREVTQKELFDTVGKKDVHPNPMRKYKWMTSEWKLQSISQRLQRRR